MIYDCKYRRPKKCTHWKVRYTVTFDLDENEECGECHYRKPNEKKFKQGYFHCDVCGEIFSKEEYEDAWDWSGPNCPNPDCYNGGMRLLIEREFPIICGRYIAEPIRKYFGLSD